MSDKIKKLQLKLIRWSPWHVGFSVLLAAFGWLTLWAELPTIAPWIVIALADSYLILELWCVAHLGDTGVERLPRLPYRKPATVSLALVLSAFVFAFGALYLNRIDQASSRSDAAYFSFVHLMTFSYEPLIFRSHRLLAASQLASGVLLLICAFPLVVSRLATFGSGIMKLKFYDCTILLPDSLDAKIQIDGSGFTWTKEDKTINATGGNGTVVVTIQKASKPGVKLLAIEPDGQGHIGM